MFIFHICNGFIDNSLAYLSFLNVSVVNEVYCTDFCSCIRIYLRHLFYKQLVSTISVKQVNCCRNAI